MERNPALSLWHGDATAHVHMDCTNSTELNSRFNEEFFAITGQNLLFLCNTSTYRVLVRTVIKVQLF